MSEVKFIVDGIKCGGCSSKIENALNDNNLIISVDINIESKEVKLIVEGGFSSMKTKTIIEDLGFSVLKMEKN